MRLRKGTVDRYAEVVRLSSLLLGTSLAVAVGACMLNRDGKLSLADGGGSAVVGAGGAAAIGGGTGEGGSGGAPTTTAQGGAGGGDATGGTSSGGSSSGGNGAGGSGGSPGPVCGNDILEAGEECDDDNTDPLDGCSATCTIEDPDECATAPMVQLQPGVPVSPQGDTTSATDSVTNVGCSSNATWYGNDHMYAFRPLADGTVTVTLNASFQDFQLHARTSCPGNSHLDCAYTTNTISFDVTPGNTYWVFVDSWQSTSGTYTVTVELN